MSTRIFLLFYPKRQKMCIGYAIVSLIYAIVHNRATAIGAYHKGFIA